MDRICWSVQKDGLDWGRVGELDLFSVLGGPHRERGTVFVLMTKLPVDRSKVQFEHDTRESAFAHAETVLADFMRLIEAKWIDE
jgi:hypothetical protein